MKECDIQEEKRIINTFIVRRYLKMDNIPVEFLDSASSSFSIDSLSRFNFSITNVSFTCPSCDILAALIMDFWASSYLPLVICHLEDSGRTRQHTSGRNQMTR